MLKNVFEWGKVREFLADFFLAVAEHGQSLPNFPDKEQSVLIPSVMSRPLGVSGMGDTVSFHEYGQYCSVRFWKSSSGSRDITFDVIYDVGSDGKGHFILKYQGKFFYDRDAVLKIRQIEGFAKESEVDHLISVFLGEIHVEDEKAVKKHKSSRKVKKTEKVETAAA